MRYQTLVLVPGQQGIFLEHGTREEAMLTINNVTSAAARHQGELVRAIPLNYSVTPAADADDMKGQA